jgi:tol-pal system protein YbgF
MLLGVGLAGCAGAPVEERGQLASELAALQREVAGLRQELVAVRQGLVELATGATEARQAEETRRAAAAAQAEGMARRLEELADTVAALDGVVGGLAEQVARVESAPAAPGGLKPEGRPPPPPPGMGPEELFDRGMASFRIGELGQAVLDFEDLAARFPGHALVPSARFWMGEAYFRARDFEHAAQEYQRALDLAPGGERAPNALLRLGLAQRALGREERARDTWGRLLRDFADSEAAQRARVLVRDGGRAPASPRPQTLPTR